MKNIQRIIWAVDPFDDSKQVETQSLAVLQKLVRRLHAKIEPLHVLSDGLMGLSLPRNIFKERYVPLSMRLMSKFLKNIKLRGLEKPQILVFVPSSKSSAVRSLESYAHKKKAGLIVVSSHGYQGLKRAILGSFAETLILHSRMPVLLSGPHGKSSQEIKHILFPTDFGSHSARTFSEVLDFAKQLGAKLTLFHVLVEPMEVMYPGGVALATGSWQSSGGYAADIEAARRKEIEKWADKARKKGVHVQTKLDIHGINVADSIIASAKKEKVGLIAIASQSGPFAAAVLGSIGRQIARNATCPILFLRR